MKHLLLQAFVFILCCLISPAQAQIVSSVKSIGSESYDYPAKVVVDANGWTYVVGHIGGSNGAAFDGIAQRKKGGFIAKYGKDKKAVWVKDDGNSSLDHRYTDLAVDAEGNVVVVGQGADAQVFSFSLLKLDSKGNVKWQKEFNGNGFTGGRGKSLAIDKEGNIYVVGSFFGDNFMGIPLPLNVPAKTSERDFLGKFTSEGEVVWFKSSPNYNLQYLDVKLDSEGNVVTGGAFLGRATLNEFTMEGAKPEDASNPFLTTQFISKQDASGKVVWAKALPFIFYTMDNGGLVLDNTNNIYLAISATSDIRVNAVQVDDVRIEGSNAGNCILLKFDPTGKATWATKIAGVKKGEFNSFIQPTELVYGNNALYLSGVFAGGIITEKDTIFGTAPTNLVQDIFLSKISLLGEKAWLVNYFGEQPEIAFNPSQKELVFAGTFKDRLLVENRLLQGAGLDDIFITHLIDSSSAQATRVSGRVFNDKNGNCRLDKNEQGFANVLVKAVPGDFYGITNSLGEYSIRLEPGKYRISPLFSQTSKTAIRQVCSPALTVTTSENLSEVKNLNFGTEVLECSQITIDIAADRRRRCFRSNTTVTYTNEGTAAAHNVKIKVIYPKYVVPISSSLPWVARQDSALIFEVGTLKPGERKSFTIADSTICGDETIRGLSQCVKAFITPRNSCTPQSQEWNQASVSLAANFTNQQQTAEFTIFNEGVGDMADSTGYRVYANAALVKEGKVKLRKGASTTLEIPAQVVTYRLEADQVPHHPGQSRPTISLQPTNIPANHPSMAMPLPIDDFYQDDADAEVDISCLEILDSFDPNDKQVSPKGISSRHYIKAEDELEYLIRFQNTGTDVAYNVVVKDTISEHLDIASLRVGSASHPFTYTVTGKGKPVVTFTFKNINLPDHKTNEPGSHGFVKFSIAQNPGNSKGTVIKNTAHNYFDFNSPIATNEVTNIIGDTVLVSPVAVAVTDCGIEEPTISRAGSDISLCETSQAVLQGNIPAKGVGKWRVVSGQAFIADPGNPNSAVQAIGYGETVLEWTITLCKKISSSQVKIFRYQLPSSPVIAEVPLQCEGDALMPLVATGANITWYSDAARQQKIAAGNQFTPSVTSSATLYATQTINGCEGPVMAVEVRIQPKKIDFVVNGDTLAAPQADSYQWFFNNEPMQNSRVQKLVAKNSGFYKVQTVTNGCISISENLKHSILLAASELKVQPNPVPEELFLTFSSNATGQVQFAVRSQLGVEVMRLEAEKNLTVLEKTLDVTSLVPGMYVLEVRLGKEVLRYKFVKL
ncbi:DUF7619 domain-containing protein [Sabulibacter ruber]|uniref:DUF7619 domain-containing protein n=1 Tax=Sabulibacter ruber TaxID=2811901 RepID=UPI001A96BE43|nr:T9SS type A sorting domain-containing protein [Sabulibacter ruber]